jgi:ketosteroid isomerase-like protein
MARGASLSSASADGGRAEQVRETMLNIYGAFERLDAQALDRNFSHSDDLLAFGTDWDEKFAGWKQYRDVHTVQFAALRSFSFGSRELEAHVHGETAWAADRPHWRIETKAGDKVESDVRVTAVLRWSADEKRWLVVQWHVSSGLKERLHEY